MDPAAALHVLGRPGTTAQLRRIAEGEHLRAYVARRTGGNTYTLSMKGHRITVRSTSTLPVGKSLRLKAEWTGDTLRLVRLTTVSQRAAASLSGGAPDTATEVTIAALVRSGMAVTPERVRTITHLLHRYGRSDSSLARLIAAVLDRGLEPRPVLMDALLAAFPESVDEDGAGRERSEGGADTGGGGRGETGERNGKGRSEEHGGGSEEDVGDRAPIEPEGEEPDPEQPDPAQPDLGQSDVGQPGTPQPPGKTPSVDEETELYRQLREQARPQPIDQARGHALQLFNHIAADHDWWQIVPYRVGHEDWRAAGTVRIRRTSSGEIRDLVLEVRDSGGSRYFRVSYGSGRPILRLPAGMAPSDGASRSLPEKLRNMELQTDDTRYEGDFDGFSSEKIGPIGSIDTLV